MDISTVIDMDKRDYGPCPPRRCINLDVMSTLLLAPRLSTRLVVKYGGGRKNMAAKSSMNGEGDFGHMSKPLTSVIIGDLRFQ